MKDHDIIFQVRFSDSVPEEPRATAPPPVPAVPRRSCLTPYVIGGLATLGLLGLAALASALAGR